MPNSEHFWTQIRAALANTSMLPDSVSTMEPSRCPGQSLCVDGNTYTLSKGFSVFVKVAGSSQRKPLTWKKQWSWAQFHDQIAIAQRGTPQAEALSAAAGTLSYLHVHQNLRHKRRLKQIRL